MMKYRLLKINNLSGKAASIYSIRFDKKQKTSIEVFISENKNLYLSELNDIIIRLKTIGKKTGAREQFFKINEGNPGDGVCALYDDVDKKLRLYCIRYGSLLIIVGGGGPKNVQTLQEDKKLKDENYFLRHLSSQITERIKDKEIWFSDDNMDLEGNLEFID